MDAGSRASIRIFWSFHWLTINLAVLLRRPSPELGSSTMIFNNNTVLRKWENLLDETRIEWILWAMSLLVEMFMIISELNRKIICIVYEYPIYWGTHVEKVEAGGNNDLLMIGKLQLICTVYCILFAEEY